MALGFKGGFAAFMDGYNKAEERNYMRDRQAKEDAWVQSQRDIKLKEQERDETLRKDLAEAAKDKQTTTPAHGPLMQENGIDIPLPDIVQTRPQTDEELLHSTEQVYRKAGKLPEALKYGSAAKQLGIQDYATKYNQLLAGASNMSVRDLTRRAIQIFNDTPNAGTIGEPRFGEDGSVTFDAYNKVTGQKLTKTFANPKQLLGDFHAYYNPASWQAEQAQKAAEAKAAALEDAKGRVMTPGQVLIKDGKPVYRVPERLNINNTVAKFKAVYGRDPTQDELIKISGLGKGPDSEASAIAKMIVDKALSAGTLQPNEAMDAYLAAKKTALGSRPTIAQPRTKAEYDALPKGAQYVKPGETQTRIKG